MLLFNRRPLYAVTKASIFIFYCLLTGCPSPSPLNQALHAENEEEALKILSGPDAAIHQRDFNGSTPLHIAIAKGYKKLVYQLVDQRADINARAFGGRTPIAFSIVYGHEDLVQFFIDRGASLETNYYDTNLLIDTVLVESPTILNMLLKAGVSINMLDGHGRTALHYAAAFGSEKMVNLLMEKGVDINHRADDGSTSLHAAAGAKEGDIIKHLLKSGVIPTQVVGDPVNATATGVLYETIGEIALQENNKTEAKKAFGIAESAYTKSADAYVEPIREATEEEDLERQQWFLMSLLVTAAGAKLDQIEQQKGYYRASYGQTEIENDMLRQAADYQIGLKNKKVKDLQALQDQALAGSKRCKKRRLAL